MVESRTHPVPSSPNWSYLMHEQVADFGLTKLAEYGTASLHTRLVGTFGYMPPE